MEEVEKHGNEKGKGGKEMGILQGKEKDAGRRRQKGKWRVRRGEKEKKYESK
jgi:hypothetical protein